MLDVVYDISIAVNFRVIKQNQSKYQVFKNKMKKVVMFFYLILYLIY